MHSAQGRQHLLQAQPNFRRKPISEAHIRAVKAVMKSGGSLFDAAWKIKLAVEQTVPDLPSLKLHVVRRILKTFAKATWVKADTRIPKTIQQEDQRLRLEFAKVLIALHEAGFHFIYQDEYSCQHLPNKTYAWRLKGQQNFLIRAP